MNRTSKYIITGAVLLLLMNATLGFFLTRQSANAMKDLIRNRMLDISNTAADMLDGDALGSISSDDADTPEYQEILKTLTYYQDNIELKYIYCIRDMGDGNFVFTVDPTLEDPGEFGDPVVYTEALYNASLGMPSVDEEPYEDAWGRFYSAYTPVFDSKGNVAGIVAVDFSADWFDEQISGQIRTTVIITILSISFAAVIVLIVVSSARKRFKALYNELNNLSEGIETLAGELTDGKVLEGTELLHINTETGDCSADEVNAIAEKIRSLQKYMGVQIDYVRAKAYKDALTGLGNRAAYLEQVERIGKDILNGNSGFAVAMFDINGLKEINDRKGHESGDLIIEESARILKESFPGEKIYRIGGDEFVVILEHECENAAERIEECKKRCYDTDSDRRLIMSVGYAVYDSTSDKSYEDVFARADRQMYENKKTYYETLGNRRRR